MHRRAEHKGVGGLGLFDGLIDHAAEHTAISGSTAAAADAAADRLRANVKNFRFNVGGVQFLGDEGQGGIGAALFVGAAVDEQNFHKIRLSFWQKTAPDRGALVRF